MLFPVHLFTGSSRKRHREPWFPESCDQVSLPWNSQFVCINCNMSYHNSKFTFRKKEPFSSNFNNCDSTEALNFSVYILSGLNPFPVSSISFYLSLSKELRKEKRKTSPVFLFVSPVATVSVIPPPPPVQPRNEKAGQMNTILRLLLFQWSAQSFSSS